MERMIFPNLAVMDLAKSTQFYRGLGFVENPQFSNEDATAMVISDTIVVMLLRQDFFQQFLPEGDRPHLRAAGKEILNCLSCDSREEVDAFLENCAKSGGAVFQPGREQMPGMYSGAGTDPDGHVWEFMWMDPSIPE